MKRYVGISARVQGPPSDQAICLSCQKKQNKKSAWKGWVLEELDSDGEVVDVKVPDKGAAGFEDWDPHSSAHKEPGEWKTHVYVESSEDDEEERGRARKSRRSNKGKRPVSPRVPLPFFANCPKSAVRSEADQTDVTEIEDDLRYGGYMDMDDEYAMEGDISVASSDTDEEYMRSAAVTVGSKRKRVQSDMKNNRKGKGKAKAISPDEEVSESGANYGIYPHCVCLIFLPVFDTAPVAVHQYEKDSRSASSLADFDVGNDGYRYRGNQKDNGSAVESRNPRFAVRSTCVGTKCKVFFLLDS